jgi:hypothetical protein
VIADCVFFNANDPSCLKRCPDGFVSEDYLNLNVAIICGVVEELEGFSMSSSIGAS